MDLSHPARTVVPSLTGDVLVVLAGTTKPMTGRQVHAVVSSSSEAGVRRVLEGLAASGLVHKVVAGNAYLYSLNRDHVAAPAALALRDLRGALFDRIRTVLQGWVVPPEAAVVFGSAARGDGGPDSDVDLLVVRPLGLPPDAPAWQADLAALSRSVTRWSGNRCSLIELTGEDLKEMADSGSRLLDEVRRDQIPLIGRGIDDVIGAQQ